MDDTNNVKQHNILQSPNTKQDRITNLTKTVDVKQSRPPDGSLYRCSCYHCDSKKRDIVRKNVRVQQSRCLQPFHMMVVERNVFVWTSKIHGHGLFAREKMEPWDIVCLYSGDFRKTKRTTSGDFVCRIDQGFIDSSDRKNFSGRWMNHSCSPNARLVVPAGEKLLVCPPKGRVAILVECVKTIYPFEEICIDYGMEYFISKNGCLDLSYCHGFIKGNMKVFNGGTAVV